MCVRRFLKAPPIRRISCCFHFFFVFVAKSKSKEEGSARGERERHWTVWCKRIKTETETLIDKARSRFKHVEEAPRRSLHCPSEFRSWFVLWFPERHPPSCRAIIYINCYILLEAKVARHACGMERRKRNFINQTYQTYQLAAVYSKIVPVSERGENLTNTVQKSSISNLYTFIFIVYVDG